MAGLILLSLVVCAWIPGVVGTAAAAALPWLGLALAVLAALALLLARRVTLILLAPILVFVRGLSVLGSTTTRVGNSDHLATVTTLTL